MNMKKKIYSRPVIEVIEPVEEEERRAGSDVTSSDTGLNFGGTDTDGVLDPLSRMLNIDSFTSLESKLPPDLQ